MGIEPTYPGKSRDTLVLKTRRITRSYPPPEGLKNRWKFKGLSEACPEISLLPFSRWFVAEFPRLVSVAKPQDCKKTPLLG